MKSADGRKTCSRHGIRIFEPFRQAAATREVYQARHRVWRGRTELEGLTGQTVDRNKCTLQALEFRGRAHDDMWVGRGDVHRVPRPACVAGPIPADGPMR